MHSAFPRTLWTLASALNLCPCPIATGSPSPQLCTDPPSEITCGDFEYVRVECPEDLPAADPRIVDVAVLDMNHGWPNLGHDCLVHGLLDASCELLPVAAETGIRIRAISFDVRRCGMIPEPPGGRFALYIGTGGPGHIDPYQNDGISEFSQGVHEDPSWQAPLYQLFDGIVADESAALLAVCHTFGVMCHWSGLAQPVLRGPEKGGKSTGVLENVLDSEGPRAPLVPPLRRASSPTSGRLRVLDNRLFDLIPAHETRSRPAPCRSAGRRSASAARRATRSP